MSEQNNTGRNVFLGISVLIAIPAINSVCGLIKSLKKNRDTKVKPAIGSVLYCDLPAGVAEHSGIYIGDNRIVHLNGKGEMEIVTPAYFLSSFALKDIYVSCMGEEAIGSRQVAENALEKIGKAPRNYNLFFDNCHKFTAGCLTGNFNNGNTSLTLLKRQASQTLHADNWLLWGR